MTGKNYWWILTICLVGVLTFAGCASSNHPASSQTNDYDSNPMSTQEYEMKTNNMQEKGQGGYPDVTASNFEPTSKEKFIVRTSLTVETKTFEESVKKIEKMTLELKGYFESVEADYTSDHDRNRSVRYVIRIPKGANLTAVNTIKSQVGSAVDEHMTTENVTKRIRDQERDIEVLKAKEDRLLALSKRTQDIEALIRIESELAEIIAMREANQADLENLEYNVQYDFLSLYLVEVRETKVVEDNNFAGDVRAAFRASLDGLVSFGQGLVLILARFWFVFLILIVLVLISRLLIKRAYKARAQKEPVRGLTGFDQGGSRPYPSQNMGATTNQGPEEPRPNAKKD